MDELCRVGKDIDYYGIGWTEDVTSLPDGVLLFRLEKESDDGGAWHIIADIRFIFVRENERKKKLGRQLFDELVNICEASGIEAIRADVPFSEEYNLCCYGLESYGFIFGITERFEITEQLGEFGKFPFVKDNKNNKAVFLKNVQQKQFREWIEKQKLDGKIDIDVSDDVDEYDNSVSTAMLKNDKVEGVFLVKKEPNGDLSTVVLSGSSGIDGKGINDLISKAYEGACEENKPDIYVHIKLHNDTDSALISHMFPERSPYIIRRGYYYL